MKPHRYLARLYCWVLVDLRAPRWLDPVWRLVLAAPIRFLYARGL